MIWKLNSYHYLKFLHVYSILEQSGKWNALIIDLFQKIDVEFIYFY